MDSDPAHLPLLLAWLNEETIWAERQYLEQTPALFDPLVDELFAELLTDEPEDSVTHTILLEYRLLLQDIRTRGATPPAILDGYINLYGGFCIDLDDWLHEVNEHGRILSEAPLSEPTVRERLHLWRAVLAQLQVKPQIPAVINAETWCRVWDAIDDLPRKTAGDRVEGRQALQQALTTYRLDRFPYQWARIQNHLGLAFMDQMELGEGDPLSTYHLAVHAFEQAEQVYHRDRFPQEWGMVENNLGMLMLCGLPGKRQENQERAITCFTNASEIFTLERDRATWIRNKLQLAQALQARSAGSRRHNHEQALQSIKEAMRALEMMDDPSLRAEMLALGGRLYLSSVADDRAEQVDQAVQRCESALQEVDCVSLPLVWGAAHHNLGLILLERWGVNPSADREAAIQHLQQALTVHTHEDLPAAWANTMNALGEAYRLRIADNAAENVEQGLACCHAVLAFPLLPTLPIDLGAIYTNLGALYQARQLGERSENDERAIAAYRQALACYSVEDAPADWARSLMNLGTLYVDCSEGDPVSNSQEALSLFQQAREVYNTEEWPLEWAGLQANMGNAYMERPVGDRLQNLLQADEHLARAQTIMTRERFAPEWALVENNRGLAARYRHDYAQAITSFQSALDILTLDHFPAKHYEISINLAEAYGLDTRWSDAHQAYRTAQHAEQLLLALADGPHERDTLLRMGRELMIRDAFALSRSGQVVSAIETIERGRGRALVDARILDTTDPQRIRDAHRRQRYLTALQRYREALATTQGPLRLDVGERHEDFWEFSAAEDGRRAAFLQRQADCRAARVAFERCVTATREAGDPPDFFEAPLALETIHQALADKPATYALVYLITTPWGGWAATIQRAVGALQYHASDVPALTSWFVDTLLEAQTPDGRIVGGYAYAQEGKGLDLLFANNVGNTFAECVTIFEQRAQQDGIASPLLRAAQDVVALPAIQAFAHRSVQTLTPPERSRLRGTLRHHFLRRELERCLPLVGDLVMTPLVDQLKAWGISMYTLIPSGALGAFPLLAAPYHNEASNTAPVGEHLPASIAPNAASLVRGASPHPRSGIFALGDPTPTHQPLPWSEAEATMIAALAAPHGAAATQRQATVSWLLHALKIGELVDASCHGQFDTKDFLNSALLLAQGQRLTLADILNQRADLRGLRILLLSACQTAMLDLRGARDEMRSLATAMLQAGVESVLAALWTIDDRAAYFLIVRFLQEWLARVPEESPAVALTRATHWLRTATASAVFEWGNALHSDLQRHARDQAPSWQSGQSGQSGYTGQGALAATTCVRGGDERFTEADAFEQIEAFVQEQNDAERPFSHPIFWAAFHIFGW